MIYKCLTYLVFAILGGCTVHVMDAHLVSMTHHDVPTAPVTKGKAIQEEWCTGDSPEKPTPDEHYGLMDEVILKAQKKHHAAYIADAHFYVKQGCMTMTGNVVK